MEDSAEHTSVYRAFPGCRVLERAGLGGGLSANASLWRLQLADGSEARVVMRRPTWQTHAETVAALKVEQRALQLARAAGVSAPKPHTVDDACAALLLEFVPGAPEFGTPLSADSVEQIARVLAQIHSVRGDQYDLSFLPQLFESVRRKLREPPETLDLDLAEDRIRAALLRSFPSGQANPDVLLHGDYWPGNWLWEHGQLAAAIDWEEAQAGDPLADVAITRLDILWAFGEAAMHAFTREYAALTPWSWNQLPIWDLVAALRPMSNLERWAAIYPKAPIHRPDVNAAHMRHWHRWFVDRALAELA